MDVSGVTGVTLGKSRTERGTGDDLESQKIPHNLTNLFNDSLDSLKQKLCRFHNFLHYINNIHA